MNVLLQQNLMTSFRLSQLGCATDDQTSARVEKRDPSDRSLTFLASPHAAHAPNCLAYSVSTAALDQLTRSMAVATGRIPNSRERRRFRIRDERQPKGNPATTPREYRETIEDNTPLGRIAAPHELAEAVQYSGFGRLRICDWANLNT